MRKTSTFVVIAAATFGAFYSVIVTLLSVLPFTTELPPWQNAVIQLGFVGAVAFMAYLATLAYQRARTRGARAAGFKAVERLWFPSNNTEERVARARIHLTELLDRKAWPVCIASVTGEWDICKPFTEKQLRALLAPTNADLQVLLSHPLSPGLARRCEKEGLDLRTMQRRVLHTTHFLIAAGGDRVRVGWLMTAPYWHVVSDRKSMHFSPFADGTPGHHTPRYIIDDRDAFFTTLRTWFADSMEAAVDGRVALADVERSLGLYPAQP